VPVILATRHYYAGRLIPGVRVDRGVFINYRGEDSHSYGALLYTELVRQFGEGLVFLDCESIPAGADFAEELVARVRSARVVLAVIGPRWLTATDATGRRRIDDPGDWIRRELAEAFTAAVPVIPVLADQAELPHEMALPADIVALGRCQYRRLRRREPIADLARIVTDLTALDPALTVAAHRRAVDQRSAVQVWRIPARLGTFTGRTSLLSALHDALTMEKPTVVQALNGMGGVGKTTLALEYAHRHAADYDVAWWVRAEQPDLIPDQLASLAQALELATSADLPDIAVARLLGQLRGQDRWLLVFDNAENPTVLSQFLPTGGHIIVTSRDPRWDTAGAAVEVAEFTRAESVDLLRSRAPRLSARDAEAVASAVGDLPLVVDHAAALLAATGWPAATYLELLQERTAEILARHDQVSGYPVSIAAAWQVTFTHLTQTDPAALQLLTLAAWLAPEPIPLTVFTDDPAVLPAPLAQVAADPLEWADLLTVLRQRAVARFGPDSLVLHRIPAALLRAANPATQPVGRWPALAVTVLEACVPAEPWNRPVTWPVWQALLPHVVVATDPTRALDTVAADVDWLLDRMAIYLHTRGDPRAARPHYERAYQQRRTRLGEDHPDTLASAGNLALGLTALGEYQQARDLDRDTLDRFRRLLGDDHSDTLTCASNLARDLRTLGQHQQAHDLDRDTVDRRRRVLGEDHPNTLNSANNLARDLFELGEYQQAHDLDRDTLNRFRRLLGEDHPDTLNCAHNVALDLSTLGEYQQARDLNQDTLNRRRRVLGDDHPDTLASAHDLALDLRVLGEYQQARGLDRDTLDRFRRVLGEDHPDTLTSAWNLALDLRMLGEHQQAYDLDHDTLDRSRRVLGEDHPNTLACVHNLAADLRMLGEHQQAYDLDQDNLNRCRRVLGEDHPNTLASANDVAADLRALGQSKLADELQKELGQRRRQT
jgi:tetratricopeptide repeat protein/TIR domain-containing protein/NB-ARC domain-containing protein